MIVRLKHITPDVERLIVYFARVSNPSNQDTGSLNLINYLLREKHFSPFEHAHATFEITTSISIAMQMIRHRFNVQQMSQRYTEALDYEQYPARRQDTKNRQNSIDDMSDQDKQWFIDAQELNWNRSYAIYKEALNRGIAKEQARFLLPVGTQTKLYVTNNLRGYIHYFQVRCEQSTQKEHRDIAIQMMNQLAPHVPTISKACQWDRLHLEHLLSGGTVYKC